MRISRRPFVNKLRRCHIPCIDAPDRGRTAFGEDLYQQAVVVPGEYLLCEALAVVGKDLQHRLIQEDTKAERLALFQFERGHN